MVRADTLDDARDSFGRHDWAAALAELSGADGVSPLRAADLERLVVAAMMLGRDDVADHAGSRAFHEHLRLGDTPRAARCAIWLGLTLLNRGELGLGSGWIARARALLDDGPVDCVEQGYLLLPDAIGNLGAGEPATAFARFSRSVEIGRRFGDPDLQSLAGMGRGTALIRLGDIGDGVESLDEAMVAVIAGEVAANVAGIVYCGVIAACLEIGDLSRAHEWTRALGHWCDAQPGLAPFRDQCLVHRAEIMQLHGEWPDALEEARRACDRMARPAAPPAVAGMALYQLAELYRLRGRLAEAEQAYEQASRFGRRPQPGLALLRLAQGQTAVAMTAIRTAVDGAPLDVDRWSLLSAHVEIALAAHDLSAARDSADELARIADRLGTPLVRAAVSSAAGAVLHAEGDLKTALVILRRGWLAYQELQAPYDAARVRVMLGLTCRSLHDEDTAAMELDAARRAFADLGADPDVARVDAILDRGPVDGRSMLSPREIDVLRLVAGGATNRSIATELFLSDKTVQRHVSNILTKLGVSTRTAAAAYAFDHGIR
jgi:DNA-binding NarL/FixJ family response regulator